MIIVKFCLTEIPANFFDKDGYLCLAQENNVWEWKKLSEQLKSKSSIGGLKIGCAKDFLVLRQQHYYFYNSSYINSKLEGEILSS